MDVDKKQFAIEVLQSRRKRIRQEEEFTPHTAWAENALTDAIKLLRER